MALLGPKLAFLTGLSIALGPSHADSRLDQTAVAHSPLPCRLVARIRVRERSALFLRSERRGLAPGLRSVDGTNVAELDFNDTNFDDRNFDINLLSRCSTRLKSILHELPRGRRPCPICSRHLRERGSIFTGCFGCREQQDDAAAAG